MTSESVPALSTEEEAKVREQASDLHAKYPDWTLVPRLLATLDAERAASAKRDARASLDRLRVTELVDLFDRATMPGDDSTPLYDYLAADGRAIVDDARAALTSEAHRG